MVPVGIIKKFASYLFPVKIREGSSAENSVLELFLYRNEWQLGTGDALYSDGTRYRPLLAGFRNIRNELRSANNALVLGTGLGSAVSILHKMECYPEITLVDIDSTVLMWAKEFIAHPPEQRLHFVRDNAADFIRENNSCFDIIIVDVFKGRFVPRFVTDCFFLSRCRERLGDKGCLVINYIVNGPDDWEQFKTNFKKVFPQPLIIDLGVNRVLIAKA